MKKTILICCLGFVFMLMACDAGDYEQNLAANPPYMVGTTMQGKPARTDLAFITQQLTTSYSTYFEGRDATLSQKVILLDSASLYVPLFSSLKPVGFTLPTEAQVEFFLTNYEESYVNLSVSSQMRSYLDILVGTDSVNYNMLADMIHADSVLTSAEKMQLHFIVTYIIDTDGDPIEDVTWTKKRIVAAVSGFEKSKANAVFNVALVKIIHG